MNKPTCFFSYCWDDDESLIEYISREVEKKSNNQIKVIYDKRAFQPSDDFKEQEQEILESDCVVCFFSESYKRVLVQKRDERGVFREYEYVKAVLEREPRQVIPVLYSGTVGTALPGEFASKIPVSIAGCSLVYNSKTKKSLPEAQYRGSISNLVAKIIKRTKEYHNLRPYQYDSETEAYDNLVFTNKANKKLPKSCMIKLSVYDSIISQRSYIVIGRKGSGKSTFFEVLEKYDPRLFGGKYKELIPISAEYLNQEVAFRLLENSKADADYLTPAAVLEMLWALYLQMYAVYIVCVEEESGKIDDDRRRVFRKMGNQLRDRLNVRRLNQKSVREALFVLCTDALGDFLQGGILKRATYKGYMASILANFTVENILVEFFSGALYDQYILAMNRCERKILISLDGFDTTSEDFSIVTNHLSESERAEEQDLAERRKLFTQLFFRSLVRTVTQIKEGGGVLSDYIDFCIVLPQDKLALIEGVDRDIAKYNFESLSWSAIDLLTLVTLRLKHIAAKRKIRLDTGEKDVVKCFYSAMAQCLPAIPHQVTIEIKEAKWEMDLFHYLLRLSFWRPRDMIDFLRVLFRINDTTVEMGKGRVDNDTLKTIINNEAKDMIQDELIGEYDKSFVNIRKVINSFDGTDLIQDAEEFMERLSRIDFITNYALDCKKIENKVKLLYELGIVGLQISDSLRDSKGYRTNYCYVYNEGLAPLELLQTSSGTVRAGVKFIFNTVFTKTLSLNMNTLDLVENYGWDYLLHNHQSKLAIKRF